MVATRIPLATALCAALAGCMVVIGCADPPGAGTPSATGTVVPSAPPSAGAAGAAGADAACLTSAGLCVALPVAWRVVARRFDDGPAAAEDVTALGPGQAVLRLSSAPPLAMDGCAAGGQPPEWRRPAMLPGVVVVGRQDPAGYTVALARGDGSACAAVQELIATPDGRRLVRVRATSAAGGSLGPIADALAQARWT